MAIKRDFTISHRKEGLRLFFRALKDEFLYPLRACKTRENNTAFGIIDPPKNEGFVGIFQDVINELLTPFQPAFLFLH